MNNLEQQPLTFWVQTDPAWGLDYVRIERRAQPRQEVQDPKEEGFLCALLTLLVCGVAGTALFLAGILYDFNNRSIENVATPQSQQVQAIGALPCTTITFQKPCKH